VPRLARRATALTASIRRSLLGLLAKSPQVFGWCRTRWSCATLALELKAQRSVHVSCETLRRWLHDLGWVWKRAKPTARDDDPERAEKLARIRRRYEQLEALGPSGKRVMLFADELDIHLLPKVGYEWTARAEQTEVWTPGKNQKAYMAGAWNAQSGQLLGCFSERKNSALFLDLLEAIDSAHPSDSFEHISVVLDNYGIHKAKAVECWLKKHPRFELLFLPAYCPKANPIERLFGDIHDHCTRNHKRRCLDELLQDVLDFIHQHRSWPYRLSSIYHEPEVSSALASLPPESPPKEAA
jgi:transposase